jgi:hypothetical protein
MPLDVLITTDRILSDPVGRWLVNHLQSNAEPLGIDDGALYYDFPTYSDYETVAHKPDALLLSPQHGILAIRLIDGANATQLQTTELDMIKMAGVTGKRSAERPFRRERLFKSLPIKMLEN